MNFKKVNNITGWAVFLIALATYMLTREARGSLWDCGEFVASADKVQLPHPPGAPLFVLLGRFFIILFGDQPQTAANAVNFMSALGSAGTILFLFWSITHFARKMFVNAGEMLDKNQLFTVMAAGVVGALAYTFSDSFWFSAVEGEVYALSSFFTAIVFWVMLKWEHADEQAGIDVFAKARSDRWIVLLFFLMGLSIGVHLLNLLTIPAIVMIYYYRRYTATTKGAIWAFLIGCLITGLVQVIIIQYSMKAAGLFDIYFVNSFKMGFFSGFTIYFIALAAVIGWGLTFREKGFKNTKAIIWFILFLALSLLPFFMSPGSSGGSKFAKFLLVAVVAVLCGYFFKPGALRILKLSLWCYAFMMLGYFVYFSALIRSNANPAIDMNNIDNPINLVYYLSREQYGSAPLIYGPHFAAKIPEDINQEDPYIMGEEKYIKGKNEDGSPAYIATGRAREYRYNNDVMRLFPRIWDSSNDQYHASFYAQWLDLIDEKDGSFKAPGAADNLNWFFTYQMSMMYWRYFMWNFGGKQNDLQSSGGVRDGNWISGIGFLDDTRLGDQSKLPESIKNNKAHNKLFMLPFILGIIGCVYQYFKTRKDWIVSFLLFFFTGIAVVLYLNQPGNQPRERDYAYVGSFFAFAIWIGLAVVAFVRLAREKADKLTLQNVLIYGSGLTFLITLMSSLRGSFSSILTTSLVVTALFALVTFGVTYLVRAISSGGQNFKLLNLSTGVNVRPDIRIINNSLLGIDWYINQLRYKINDAPGIDVIWSEDQIEGHNREFMRFKQDERANPAAYYSLIDVMKNVLGKKTIDPETGRDVGSGYFPISKFKVDVDVPAARASGLLNANDSAVSPMVFEIPQSKLSGGLMRNDLIILNIIAANNWKRPIYFTSPYGELGFAQYLRKDGLAYRLVPVENKFPQNNWEAEKTLRESGAGGTQLRDNNTDTMYNNLMTKFLFGGAEKNGTYFDEENRRHLLGIRSAFAEAAGNMADLGRKEEASKLLDKVEKGILADNMPYAMVSRFSLHNQTALIYLEAAYKAGRKDLSDKLRAAIRKDLTEQKAYYDNLKTERPELYGGQMAGTEAPYNELMIHVLDAIEKRYGDGAAAPAPTEGGAGTIINNPADSMPKQDSLHK
ncbi:MAG: DUF2723 domain-containing protein [Chitinophagaceae bacterium]|nr:MAG: DUF2723 domain-containing protein [Chitinophagaceae bacterium]